MTSEPFDFKNEKLREVIEFVELHPNEYTYSDLSTRFNLTEDSIRAGVRRAKQKYNLVVKSGKTVSKPIRELRKSYIPPPPNTETVLVIGDTHEPFTLEGYREFCYETYKKYKCTHVIFIGDLIDGHASSYHTTNPDAMGAGSELDLAIENIGEWYKLFPKADVVLGNHDRIVMRKASDGGVPRKWIMDFQDVFEVPTWHFTSRVVYNGVQYIHGEGGTARTRAKKDLMSTVQGHLHPQAYTEYIVGETYKIFGMQVGCGVDRHAYAFGYAKDHPKPAIGVGVVANHGKHPINVLMEL